MCENMKFISDLEINFIFFTTQAKNPKKLFRSTFVFIDCKIYDILSMAQIRLSAVPKISM